MAAINYKELIGKTLNGYLVLGPAPKVKTRHRRWFVRNEFGLEQIVRTERLLKSPRTRARASYARHGMVNTPEYRSWQGLVNRCTNPNNHAYPDYGGRGIKVCDSWLAGFENFYADMGPKPSPGLSIDRINNDGNYEPGNCRWATIAMQAANKRPRSR